MRTALILGPGALSGGYGAGVASVLGRNIHFDKIYGCSVGVFAATFLATRQFDIMLNIWRNHVHGNLLINFRNPFRRRNILDLEYLNGLFKREEFLLNVELVSGQYGRLVHVLTHYLSGKPEYFLPTGDNIFDSMSASSAVPYLHPRVRINQNLFYDGAISDPTPLQRALSDGNEKVVIVSNLAESHDFRPVTRLSRIAILSAHKSQEAIQMVESRSRDNPNIILLRPATQILKGFIDTDKKRINQTIDLGIRDAELFLKTPQAL